jgi:uncharacterized membrane protein
MEEDSAKLTRLGKLFLFVWLVCLLYIVFMLLAFNRPSLEWKVSFLPDNTAVKVRCDLIRQYLALPICAFIPGAFIARILRDKIHFFFEVRLLLRIIAMAMVIIGISYCYPGLLFNMPQTTLRNMLWSEPLLAVIWWFFAGIGMGWGI